MLTNLLSIPIQIIKKGFICVNYIATCKKKKKKNYIVIDNLTSYNSPPKKKES